MSVIDDNNISHVDKKKKQQEVVAKLAYPVFLLLVRIYRAIYRTFRVKGIAYGLNRARQRARVACLGEYSDICSDVVIKSPENLRLGRRSSISHGCFIDAGGGVSIGDYVMISHMVSINTMSHPTTPPYHSSTTSAEIKIHSHAWIGAGSVIVQGVEIGEGAIVGAGSVVTHSVAPWTVVAGIPAKYLRQISLE